MKSSFSHDSTRRADFDLWNLDPTDYDELETCARDLGLIDHELKTWARDLGSTGH